MCGCVSNVCTHDMVDGQEAELEFEWAFMLTCCGELRQCFNGLMLYSSIIDDVKDKLQKAEVPACEAFCCVGEVKYPLKYIVVSSTCETLTFEIWPEK